MARQESIDIRHGERGAILVAVLWFVTIATLLVVSVGRDVGSSAELARLDIDRLRTQAVLESALEVAAARLISTSEDGASIGDGRAEEFSVGGATVGLSILDGGGLVDIRRAEPDLLRAFVDRIAGPRANGLALAEAIVARRSKDRKRPIQAVDEIYELASGDAGLAEKLMPFIGLYSKDGRIDLFAAPREIIESVPDIAASDTELVMSARRGRSPDAAALKQIAARYGKYLSAEPGDIFVVEAKVLDGPHLVPGSRLRAAIALDRKNLDAPYRIVSLSW
jgi:general secretion pathway protein K